MEQEILKRLDLLAAKLGVATSHLWAITVHQARVDAIQSLIWVLLWLPLTTFCLKKAYKCWNNKGMPEDFESINTVVMAVSGGIGLLGILMFMIILTGMVTPILNPEYWAFKEIIKQLSGK